MRGLMAGGILTFISGIGLMGASQVVLVLLTLLVIYYGFYMWRQHKRVKLASSSEEAMPAPGTL